VYRDAQVCRGIFLSVPPNLKLSLKVSKIALFWFFQHLGVPPNLFLQISVQQTQNG
jgi:hypothetical protein